MVTRRIYINNPTKHIDVNSRIDGFVAHVVSFRQIEVIGFRPLSSEIPNVQFKQADLMKPIQNDAIDYCDPLSCLYVLELFGLCRYREPINNNGYLFGFNNLFHILNKDVILYLSVPIGIY